MTPPPLGRSARVICPPCSLNNAVANAQPQARAFAHALGGIERLENRLRFLDAGPGILEFGVHLPIFSVDAHFQTCRPRPTSSMASTALLMMLRNTCSSWCGSAVTAGARGFDFPFQPECCSPSGRNRAGPEFRPALCRYPRAPSAACVGGQTTTGFAPRDACVEPA